MAGESVRGESELKRMANATLEAVDADQAEVVIRSGVSSLTRFANNYIHQNVEERDLRVQVRAVIGKKVGVAASDIVTPDGLRELAGRAVALARLQQDNPDFVSLPGPTPMASVEAVSPRTVAFRPEDRAEVVRLVCAASAGASLAAAGAFRTEQSEMAVANSLGVWAYHPSTSADFNTVLMGETSSGHAEHWSLDAGDIDGEALASEAIEKARRGVDPQVLEPGSYPVILEEYAVADILDYFAYLSFGAQAYLEKRSFMSGRLGEKVMGDNISIWDDGLALNGMPAPFDFEGVAKQRVDLINDGIAANVVWDSYYGSKAGEASTGHALPAGETFGPVTGNLYLGAGETAKQDLISGIERGVWVSRFWYTRPVHPLKVILTGMTRDGTFLIENGRIAGPIKNLRFTQSYLEAMNNVEAIGRETKLLPLFFGTCRVPALRISSWDFTGATEF